MKISLPLFYVISYSEHDNYYYPKVSLLICKTVPDGFNQVGRIRYEEDMSLLSCVWVIGHLYFRSDSGSETCPVEDSILNNNLFVDAPSAVIAIMYYKKA